MATRTLRDATVELELRFDSLVFDSLFASLAAVDRPTVECWGCGVALQVEDAFEDSGGHWVGECCDVPPHARLAPPQGIVSRDRGTAPARQLPRGGRPGRLAHGREGDVTPEGRVYVVLLQEDDPFVAGGVPRAAFRDEGEAWDYVAREVAEAAAAYPSHLKGRRSYVALMAGLVGLWSVEEVEVR